MNSTYPNGWTPSAELLAAFADGELDHRPALRCQVEKWLADHPSAAADVEAQRELARLLAMTAPSEPAPEVWADMWRRTTETPLRQPRRWPTGALIAGLTAAAVAVMVLLPMTRQPSQISNQQPQVNPGEPEPPVIVADALPERLQVFPVLRADEVEILQIAGADTDTVVIGHVPAAEPLMLLHVNEFQFMSQNNGDDQTEIRTGSGAVPMAWSPLPGEGG
jgi:hypothetical protein